MVVPPSLRPERTRPTTQRENLLRKRSRSEERYDATRGRTPTAYSGGHREREAKSPDRIAGDAPTRENSYRTSGVTPPPKRTATYNCGVAKRSRPHARMIR